MAQYNKINQNKESVTAPKKTLIAIAMDDDLKKKDYRVLMMLLTILDSSNYTMVDMKAIAKTLDMTTKDVRNSMMTLEYNNIITCGSDVHVIGGYRFLMS